MMGFEFNNKDLTVKLNKKEDIDKLQEAGGLLYDENRITYLEAIFFAEKGVLDLEGKKLMNELKEKDKLAEDKFKVFEHLRSKGYQVRLNFEDSSHFRVYQKGFRPGEDKTKSLVKVIENTGKLSLSEIEKYMEVANNLRKELILAYIDKVNQRPVFIKINRTNFQ